MLLTPGITRSAAYWRVQSGDRQFKVANCQFKVAIASSKWRIVSSKWRSPVQSGNRQVRDDQAKGNNPINRHLRYLVQNLCTCQNNLQSKENYSQTCGLSNLEMKHVGKHAIIGYSQSFL